MSSNQNTKNNVIYSLFWKLLERGGSQGIQLIIQIILARLLTPEEFGTIAIVLVFINLGQVFVQSGFGTALIQKKEVDNDDFSSVFYLSVAIAVLFYTGIYFSAPLIAQFYSRTELTPILRVLSLTLFTGAFNSIQNAVVSRRFQFKLLFKSSLGAVLISGVSGVICAYLGFGVWSLVVQQLINHISITLIMWYTVNWRPELRFSIVKVKRLFSFGSKLLASELINVLYLNLRTLIIGRLYTASVLGYYNRGEQFPKIIVSNLNGSIQSVMLPTLSTYQDEKLVLKNIVRRSIKVSSYIVFPMMFGLASVAEPVIYLVLGEQWMPTVPFLQIFCFTYALMPIHTANLQAINAVGRSDIFFRLEVIKKIIGIIILIYTVPKGVIAIAVGQIFSGIITTFINSFPNRKLLNYGYKEQIIDIIPHLVVSMIMGLVVNLVGFIDFPHLTMLILQLLTGLISYLFLSWISRLETFFYIMNTAKELVSKRRKD